MFFQKWYFDGGGFDLARRHFRNAPMDFFKGMWIDSLLPKFLSILYRPPFCVLDLTMCAWIGLKIIALAFLMKAQWWSHFAGLDRFGWVPTVNGHPVWVFFLFQLCFLSLKKNCGQQWRIRRRLDVVKLGTTRISYLTFYIRWQFWAQTL